MKNIVTSCLGHVALALALLGAPHAHAGRTCEEAPLTALAVQQGILLAEHTAAKLDATGARVVVLARAGQDLSKYGLRYSHLGLAYKDGEAWYVVHKLNQCGTDHASVYRQGLGQFFLDTPFDYVAGVVVLAPEVQDRLLPLLKDGVAVTRLHTPAYSMLAYPWATQYQQSNQWAIETLALAMEPTIRNRDKAQAWLKFKGYEPSQLSIPALTRLGARMTRANVSFDDHPNHLRYSGKIQTVTVDSVFAWLQAAELGSAPVAVR